MKNIFSRRRRAFTAIGAVVLALSGLAFARSIQNSGAPAQSGRNAASLPGQASTTPAVGQAKNEQRPLLLYTDVLSGPDSGGEGNNGIYLTLFGRHFGAAQGSSRVTIDGQDVAQYLLWSDTKIGVQVGHVSSGPIVVSVNGADSNSDKTFTVRKGRIRFVGPAVDNSSAGCGGGTYERPWGLTNFASKNETAYTRAMRTPTAYYHCLSLGDTLVFLDGVSYPGFDGYGWHASLTPDNQSASAEHFITVMARPGARVQLGGTGGAMASVRDTSNGYNVFSGLRLTGSGANGSVQLAAHDRAVGNEITCPDCWGPSGALMGGDDVVLLGNDIHDVSTLLPAGSNKTYHAIYVAGNNIEIAWNRIHDTRAYNGIQINHDKSPGFYNQSYHDNDIADVNGSGINLSTIDPSMGYVRLFNNVIHHVGLNIADQGGGYDPHSCIAVKGYGTATAPGMVEVYHNTMVDCSSYLNLNTADNAACAILVMGNQLNVVTNLVDNIIYQPAYAGAAKQNVFLCSGNFLGTVAGSNNIWYSPNAPRSNAAAIKYGTIADPKFVSNSDFHLRESSPARRAGIPIGNIAQDHDGVPRPATPAIGAYE